MKKLTAIILCLVMLVTVIPMQALATENGEADASGMFSQNEVYVSGNNSVGDLLAETINEAMTEQQQNSGNVVYSAEVYGSEATVTYSSAVDCTLLVGIYTEDALTLICSGSGEVSKDEKTAYITLSETVPEYFYIKAYLIDTEDLSPISAVYNGTLYTKEMKEFLSKTTDDFEEEKVLNFDDDTTKNFGVLSDDVVKLNGTGDENTVTEADSENNVYTFDNASSDLKNLQPGDIFLNGSGDDLIIVKVGTITVSGETVTVTGAETNPEEVFDYLRIDETSTIDTDALANEAANNTENTMVYEGTTPQPVKALKKVSGDAEYGESAKFTFTEKNIANKSTGKFDCKVKVSGSVEIAFKASVSFYITLTYYEITAKFDYSAKVGIDGEGSVEGCIPMPVIPFIKTGVLNVSVLPVFTPEISGKISVSAELKGTFGFKKASDTDCENISSAPKFRCMAQWSNNRKRRPLYVGK